MLESTPDRKKYTTAGCVVVTNMSSDCRSPYRGQRLGAGFPQPQWSLLDSLVAGEGILAAVEQEDNSAVEEGSPAAAVVGIQVVVEVDNKQVVAPGNHLQPAAVQCSFAAVEKWEREGSFAAGDQLGSSLVAVAVGSSLVVVAGGSSG